MIQIGDRFHLNTRMYKYEVISINYSAGERPDDLIDITFKLVEIFHGGVSHPPTGYLVDYVWTRSFRIREIILEQNIDQLPEVIAAKKKFKALKNKPHKLTNIFK